MVQRMLKTKLTQLKHTTAMKFIGIDISKSNFVAATPAAEGYKTTT